MGSRGSTRRSTLYMLAPAVLTIAVVAVFPVARSIYLGFQRVVPAEPSTWVGIANYSTIFRDPDFLDGIRTTALFTASSTGLSFALGLAF
ncbi:MAG: sugar ABC transporter permease, partial [Actinobacteria bacterium]|nr:sugar ABC transporter permease [Actinomycetota bacterium]